MTSIDKRFALLSDDDLEKLGEKAKNSNTQRSTAQWLGIFQRWASVRGVDVDLHKYQPSQLLTMPLILKNQVWQVFVGRKWTCNREIAASIFSITALLPLIRQFNKYPANVNVWYITVHKNLRNKRLCYQVLWCVVSKILSWMLRCWFTDIVFVQFVFRRNLWQANIW